MKLHYLLLFTLHISLFSTPSVLTAQNCQDYTCNIAKARTALSHKKFKEAIDYCKAAKAYPNANIADADAVIYQIFVAIEKEKEEANRARKEAENQKQLVEQKSKELEKALARNQKIINSIYFYKEKYALVHQYAEGDGEYVKGEFTVGEFNPLQSGFYFIDKNGNESIQGKMFTIAFPFEESTGFARVKEHEADSLYSFLDTLGNLYPLVTKLEQLNDKVTALDLTNSSITNVPFLVFKNTQLKVILLCNNQITSLDSEFKNLSNLTILNLRGNPIPKEEQEKIKKLLPNCKIEF